MNNSTVLISKDVNKQKITNFKKENSFSEFKNKAIYKNDIKEKDFQNVSFNPFLLVATPLIESVLELKENSKELNMDDIRDEFIAKINTFNELAVENKIENMEILVARYILCTFIDEIVNSTFSNNDSWFNKSLLNIFHNETYGGENFFHLMDKFLKTPAKYINILELMYICLSLGFLGKYRVVDRGEMEINNIKDSLYKQIKIVQGRDPIKFYTKVEPIKRRYKLFNKISYPLLLTFIFLLLTTFFIFLSYRLYEKNENFLNLINNISNTNIQKNIEETKNDKF
ncbi:MAG: type IVB secretion system protein IcmH/DotU [Arcobacter sp.]|uniref:type IVB secretion system protein IcmH/DotU n=1 Tax=unclassified Arcobacter TaxID=2593671 RepID=UPI0002296048|nr:type IVB secretion system protein IcmH/DotU [Arcobacter sp. L]BAK74055.1 conserved hypothetical protein [Arcobacter sp. L]